MAHAMGCGLIAITSGDRELCWDAALAKGLPIYGLRDDLILTMTRLRAASVMSALAFGVFHCVKGKAFATMQLEDERQGVTWSGGPEDLSTAVILREGYEAQRLSGPAGEWRDRGNEGVVRLRMTAPSHQGGGLWSQPRFIMPGAQAMPKMGPQPGSQQ